jgi:hypothetical protein
MGWSLVQRCPTKCLSLRNLACEVTSVLTRTVEPLMNEILHFYRNILCTYIPFLAVSYKQIFKQSLLTEKQNVCIAFTFSCSSFSFRIELVMHSCIRNCWRRPKYHSRHAGLKRLRIMWPEIVLTCTAVLKKLVPETAGCSGEKPTVVSLSVLCLTTDWTTGVRLPTEAKDISSNLCVQIGSEAHPASCTMGTGGITGQGIDADHSPHLNWINLILEKVIRNNEFNQGGSICKRILQYLCEISSSHGGEYEVQNCLLGCTAV